MMAKKRIGFSMIFYPVAMGRYLLEALLRRDDTQVVSAGPFTGNWIPWKGGMHVPPKYVRKPDAPLPFSGPPTLNYQDPAVANLAKDCDLWIEANAGLMTIGRPPCKYAVVGTDPHVLDYTEARKKADRFFCMQRPYMAEGDVWLPYAYDPVWHTPSPIPPAERSYDAALVGLMYDSRATLVASLRQMGLQVYFDTGPSYDDAQRIYHATRVGLNWSSAKDTTARVFELMAFGIVPVLNRVPDLRQMFVDGQDFIGFDTVGEAIGSVVKYAHDPMLCEAMGLQAREAVEPHTWDARINFLLGEMGLV